VVLAQPGDHAIVVLLAKGTLTAPASPDPMAIRSGVPNVATGLFALARLWRPRRPERGATWSGSFQPARR
jgi:hypothetical protein